jgi:hypothetical protein
MSKITPIDMADKKKCKEETFKAIEMIKELMIVNELPAVVGLSAIIVSLGEIIIKVKTTALEAAKEIYRVVTIALDMALGDYEK